MELLIPEEMSPISFRSSCFDIFCPEQIETQQAFFKGGTEFIELYGVWQSKFLVWPKFSAVNVVNCINLKIKLVFLKMLSQQCHWLTLSVSLLHARVLLLEIHLEVFQHLDLQRDGAPLIRQKPVIQRLHLWNEHLTRVHDEQEPCRTWERKW